MLSGNCIGELDRLLDQFGVRMDKDMRMKWCLSNVTSQII